MSMTMIMRAKSKARAAATDVSIQDYMVGVMVRYEGGLHDGWFPQWRNYEGNGGNGAGAPCAAGEGFSTAKITKHT